MHRKGKLIKNVLILFKIHLKKDLNMMTSKWEYKIVDLNNSTSMGYSNTDTEEFKEKHKGENWKLIMMNIEINKLGQDGWEMVSMNGSDEIYFKRPEQT